MRPLRLTILMLLLVCISQIAGAQTNRAHWTQIQVPGDSLWPVSLNFADSSIGYLLCARVRINSGSAARQIDNVYFRTSDGGRSWQRMSFGGPFCTFKTSASSPIWPVSKDIAFTYAVDTTTSRYSLLRTTNSGLAWSVIPLTAYPHDVDISPGNGPWAFFSKDYIVGYGKYATTLSRSTDGGQTFSEVNRMQDLANFVINGHRYNDSGYFPGYSYYDSARWIAVMGDQADSTFRLSPPGITTMLSTDAGVHWTPFNTPVPDSLRSAFDFRAELGGGITMTQGSNQKPIPNTSYLFGGSSGEFSRQGFPRESGPSTGQLTFYYTPDYGETWHFGCDFQYRTRGFEAVDTNELWMTVLPRPNAYSIFDHSKVFTTNFDAYWIVHSTDLGKTWDIDSTTLYPDLDRGPYDGAIVSSSDPGHVWIAAENRAHTYIFRYDKSEQPSAGVEEYVPMNYPNFVNVYPNPANTHTTITLARYCPITTVRVVDIMGREQTTPMTRFSEYSVDLDISKLGSGIYIAGISTPYGPYTKLVVIAR